MLTPVLEQMNQGQSTPTEQHHLMQRTGRASLCGNIAHRIRRCLTKIFNENNLNYKKTKYCIIHWWS
jgi:hypothetical protein